MIEGRIGNAAGALVFTVSVDGTRQRHARPDPRAWCTCPDDRPTPTTASTLAAANLVTLTATITDGDGDTATPTLNIGQNLNFEDDGPSDHRRPARSRR